MIGIPWRVLVTGGAGFIGGHVVRRLLCEKRDVTRVVILDLLSYAGSMENISDCLSDARCEFVKGDIADQALVTRLLRTYQINAVIHLAAETHVDRSIYGPMAFAQTNTMGTVMLLEAVRQHWEGLSALEQTSFRFLHVSTDEVYGSIEQGKFLDTDPYRPNSPYSASKAAADHFVRAWHQTYGLPTLTSHCSNNFGPYQHPEKLIPRAIRAVLTGGTIPLYGGGTQVRDWLYVSDHADFLWFYLNHGDVGTVVNIGGECEWQNRALLQKVVTIVASRLGLSQDDALKCIVESADRPGHDRRYAIDNQKVRAMGWHRWTNFERALTETIDWYLTHKDWLTRRQSYELATDGH